MASPCKHWIVHQQICCGCKRRVKIHDVNSRVARNPCLFSVCPHRMYQRRFCCRCGYFLDIWCFARAFNYIAKSLRMSLEFEAAIKSQKLRIGVGQRKLHLVLNLEHILVDRISVSKLSELDKYHLIQEAALGSRDDLFRFPKDKFYSSDVLVKLRPFVREFLREAGDFFTMHVFTNYGPDHAREIVKLLDPYMIYFGNRVITSRDSKGYLKSLELVLAEQRGVLIVDYDKRLWTQRDHGNMIVISKYEFFKESCNEDGIFAKTLSFLKKMFLRRDDKVVGFEGKRKKSPDDDGKLFGALTFLKALHKLFFSGRYQDVSPLRSIVYAQTLFST